MLIARDVDGDIPSECCCRRRLIVWKARRQEDISHKPSDRPSPMAPAMAVAFPMMITTTVCSELVSRRSLQSVLIFVAVATFHRFVGFELLRKQIPLWKLCKLSSSTIRHMLKLHWASCLPIPESQYHHPNEPCKWSLHLMDITNKNYQ